MATLSVSNYNQNAPQWWKRLETACITFLVPSFISMIMAIPLDDHKRVLYTAGAAFFGGLLKAIGILMGESTNGDKKDQ